MKIYYVDTPTAPCECGGVLNMTMDSRPQDLIGKESVNVHGHCAECHMNIEFEWPVKSHPVNKFWICDVVNRPRNQVS